MRVNDHIPAADIWKYLSVDFETGTLTRLSIDYGGNRSAAHKTRWGGKPTGCSSSRRGGPSYIRVDLAGKGYLAHRIIWAMATGAWPTEQIDHINGDPQDNRLSNLREVSHHQNHRNTKMISTNTSGVTGVDWQKREQRWRARIIVNKKEVNLGYFINFDEAVAARKKALLDYGFDPLHGMTAGERLAQ